MNLKKVSQKLLHNIHLIGFLSFMVLFLYFHKFVYMGADDFYYANFWDYGIGGFIRENIHHYKNLTGRAFVHLLCETVLSLGMGVFGIVNSIFIGLTIFFSARIAAYDSEKKSVHHRFKFTLLICLFLFLSLNIMILRESVFWVSGSYNYLFPVMLQVIYFYLLNKDIEYQSKNKFLFILSFLSGATVEQTGIIVILTNLFLIINYYIRNKGKPHFIYFINFFAGILGYTTLFLSPGVTKRITQHGSFTSLPLLSKIKINLPLVSRMIIGENGIGILLAVIMIFTCIFIFKNKTIKTATVFLLCILSLSSIMLILSSFLIIISEFALILTTVFSFIGLVSIAIYTFFNGEYIISFFIAIALATISVMLVSPVLGMRMIFAGSIFLIIVLCRLMVISDIKLNIFVIILLIISSVNFLDYLEGYKQNADILKENLNRTKALKTSEDKNLTLLASKDEFYGYENIPVKTNFVDSFKRLHNLPENISITVTDTSERSTYVMNKEIPDKAVLRNNVIYIPIRAFFEEIGYTVLWKDSCGVAKLGNREYYFKPGSSVVLIKTNDDNKNIKLNAPVRSIHSSVYFPGDFIKKVLLGNTSINKNEVHILLD